jgi:hypothetical protein
VLRIAYQRGGSVKPLLSFAAPRPISRDASRRRTVMTHQSSPGARRAAHRRLLVARAEVVTALAAVTAAEGVSARLRASEELRRAGRAWAEATARHRTASAEVGRLAQWRRRQQVRADRRLAERVAAVIAASDAGAAAVSGGVPDWLRDVRG